MFAKASVVVVLAMIVSAIECKQSYDIKGSWKNELEKCGSGGDETRTINFNIGILGSILPELKYEDIGTSTAVNAHGNFELLTSTGSEVKQQLHLTDYEDKDTYKSFSKSWRRATTSGLASQTVAITLNLKIHNDGMVELISDVYAGSWLAITCASGKATVETIEIIN